MTSRPFDASQALSVVREGSVITNLPGQAKSNENQLKNLMYRVCRKAGLPERGWHCCRHTFGTHAALMGVNPWRLMAWMGHKKIASMLPVITTASCPSWWPRQPAQSSIPTAGLC